MGEGEMVTLFYNNPFSSSRTNLHPLHNTANRTGEYRTLLET